MKSETKEKPASGGPKPTEPPPNPNKPREGWDEYIQKGYPPPKRK